MKHSCLTRKDSEMSANVFITQKLAALQRRAHTSSPKTASDIQEICMNRNNWQ